MFRRRHEPDVPEVPEWRGRVDAARRLIESQQPPAFVLEQLDALARVVGDADADRVRLGEVAARLDAERAAQELKAALRRPDPSPEHERLVESLRARYESVHRVSNRVEGLDTAIERALVDLDLLAARSVELGVTDGWQLDDAVRRLGDDLTALERAHDDVRRL